MNTQNKHIVHYVLGASIGLIIGFIIWGNNSTKDTPQSAHMMPDGTMMMNDGSSMASMMQDMNKSLEGKSGDAFDEIFIKEMIVHHEGAVDMAKLALTNAKHQEIKDLAQAIIKAQDSEIAQMKTWLKDWYN